MDDKNDWLSGWWSIPISKFPVNLLVNGSMSTYIYRCQRWWGGVGVGVGGGVGVVGLMNTPLRVYKIKRNGNDPIYSNIYTEIK